MLYDKSVQGVSENSRASSEATREGAAKNFDDAADEVGFWTAETQRLLSEHVGEHNTLLVADLPHALPSGNTGQTAPRKRVTATVDAIKRYIVSHGLRPGDPLPTEATICEDLGVSRTSVREALRRLAALDIVRSHQGRGSFVGEMSLGPLVETLVLRNAVSGTSGSDALREVARARRYLDLGMAEELTKAMEGREHPRLRALVQEMPRRVENGETYIDLDIAFHEELSRELGNTLISQLVSAMWLVHQAVIPNLGPQLPEALRTAALTHATMLDALEAGDVEGYRQAVIEHYQPLESFIGGDTVDKETQAEN